MPILPSLVHSARSDQGYFVRLIYQLIMHESCVSQHVAVKQLRPGEGSPCIVEPGRDSIRGNARQSVVNARQRKAWLNYSHELCLSVPLRLRRPAASGT